MQISIELSDEQSARLQHIAESLGIEVDELARAAFRDALTQPREDFLRSAAYVVRKNRDLYERLR